VAKAKDGGEDVSDGFNVIVPALTILKITETGNFDGLCKQVMLLSKSENGEIGCLYN
jgi:hypothetical protein